MSKYERGICGFCGEAINPVDMSCGCDEHDEGMEVISDAGSSMVVFASRTKKVEKQFTPFRKVENEIVPKKV